MAGVSALLTLAFHVPTMPAWLGSDGDPSRRLQSDGGADPARVAWVKLGLDCLALLLLLALLLREWRPGAGGPRALRLRALREAVDTLQQMVAAQRKLCESVDGDAAGAEAGAAAQSPPAAGGCCSRALRRLLEKILDEHSARAQTPQLDTGDEEDGTSAEAQERARREREKERRLRTPEIVAQVSFPCPRIVPSLSPVT